MDIGNLDNVFGKNPSLVSNNNNMNTTVGSKGKTTLDDIMAQVGDYDGNNATPAGQVDQDDDEDSDDDLPEEKEAPVSKPDDRTAVAAAAIVDAAVKVPTTTVDKEPTSTAAPVTPSST